MDRLTFTVLVLIDGFARCRFSIFQTFQEIRIYLAGIAVADIRLMIGCDVPARFASGCKLALGIHGSLPLTSLVVQILLKC
jgi:hypothetical protein